MKNSKRVLKPGMYGEVCFQGIKGQWSPRFDRGHITAILPNDKIRFKSKEDGEETVYHQDKFWQFLVEPPKPIQLSLFNQRQSTY